MRISTGEQLSDVLDENRVWRLREVDRLVSHIDGSTGEAQGTYIRAGVTLLYAHWEGFVKYASESYLEFVGGQISRRRLRSDELSASFLALVLRRVSHQAADSKRMDAFLGLADFVMGPYGDRCTIRPHFTVNTHANLSSSVLTEILKVVGLHGQVDGLDALTEEIDALLSERNLVAHGGQRPLSPVEFRRRAGDVLDAMRLIQTALTNAAVTGAYMRVPVVPE